MLNRLMADEQSSDDSDDIKLSASTLAALQEFYAEHSASAIEQAVPSCQNNNALLAVMPAEDWVILILFFTNEKKHCT